MAANATATTQGYHLGANTIFTVGSTGATGADLTVSAPLRNQSGDFADAAGGFTKSGTGTMLLSGANTYTGGTTVNQGTLTVQGTGATLGTGALAVNNANTGAGIDVIVNFNTNANQTVSGLSSTIAKPSSGTNTVQVNIASGSTLTDTQSGTTNYAGSVSGGGTLAIGGQSSSAPATVNYTGTDSAAQTNVNANATLQLNNAAGPALSNPMAVATSGTVLLGGNNQIATTAPGTASPTNVALSGGTLNANGHSDGVTNGSTDPTQAAVTSSMGTLSLASGASTLDFGSGSTNDIIAFADSLSSLQSGTGTLNIINYTGGTDALYIGTTQDLTQAELSRITFGGNIAAIQYSNGLVAAPEPSQYASFAVGLLGLGALVLRAKKRKAAAAQAA